MRMCCPTSRNVKTVRFLKPKTNGEDAMVCTHKYQLYFLQTHIIFPGPITITPAAGGRPSNVTEKFVIAAEQVFTISNKFDFLEEMTDYLTGGVSSKSRL